MQTLPISGSDSETLRAMTIGELDESESELDGETEVLDCNAAIATGLGGDSRIEMVGSRGLGLEKG